MDNIPCIKLYDNQPYLCLINPSNVLEKLIEISKIVPLLFKTTDGLDMDRFRIC